MSDAKIAERDFDRRATKLYRRLREIVDGHYGGRDDPPTAEEAAKEVYRELTPGEALMATSAEFQLWMIRHARALGVNGEFSKGAH